MGRKGKEHGDQWLATRLHDWLSRPLPCFLIALFFAAVVLVPGIGKNGFWEPHEIKVADQAWQLLLPTSGELDRIDTQAKAEVFREQKVSADPQARDPRKKPKPVGPAIDGPALSEEIITWGMRTGGASDLSARLPLVALALLTVIATFVLGVRFAGPRAALIASLVLLSFPLFVVQARQLNSDIGAVCGSALIALGIAGTTHLSPIRGLRLVLLALDLALIAIGAVISYLSAGALLGLAVPFGAFGIAGTTWWLGSRLGSKEAKPAIDVPDKSECLAIGWGAAAAMVCAVLALGLVAHELFTWVEAYPGDRAIAGMKLKTESGYMPALGGAWRDIGDVKLRFTSQFELIAFGTFPWIAVLPFALARMGHGMAVQSAQSRRTWAGYVAFMWAVLAWIVASIIDRKIGRVSYPALVPLALAVGIWVDNLVAARHPRGNDGAVNGTDRNPGWLAWPALALFVALAAVVVAKDLVSFPERMTSLTLGKTTLKYPEGTKVHFGFLLIGIAFAGCIAGSLATRRALQRRLSAAAVGLGVISALFMTQLWTPTLSRKLSSKGIFEVYDQLRRKGDVLGIMGSHGSGPRYYAEDDYEEIANRGALLTFLARPERVFAIARASELCPVHKAAGAGNFENYVLDDRNATYLLLSNQLREGEIDQNQLAQMIVREEPASIEHRLSANFDDKIELIGFTMPANVSRGSKFELTLYYKVLAPVGKNWKIFVHFDGGGLRFQGDHDPIDGRCGTSHFQAGDYIVDTFTVEAGGISYPKTDYKVWTGFFTGSAGNWTNMKATTGNPDDNNRVQIGTISVR